MIAATLIHIPKSFVPELDMRDMSQACIEACESLLEKERATPDLDYLCIKWVIMGL